MVSQSHLLADRQKSTWAAGNLLMLDIARTLKSILELQVLLRNRDDRIDQADQGQTSVQKTARAESHSIDTPTEQAVQAQTSELKTARGRPQPREEELRYDTQSALTEALINTHRLGIYQKSFGRRGPEISQEAISMGWRSQSAIVHSDPDSYCGE